MKIGVILKQVPDTETKIVLNNNSTDIVREGIKYVINPYDEYAIEEALKLKEKLADNSETVVITAAPKRATEALRTALAMGIDRAIHIVDDNFDNSDSYITAKVLAQSLNHEKFDIIFSGKQAVDGDCAQVGQAVAEFLKIPHCIPCVKFEFDQNNKLVIVERDVEGGTREVIQIIPPCLIGVTKGINEPRYASLPGIMKAKKKEIKELNFQILGFTPNFINESKKVNIIKYSLPIARTKGKIITGDPQTQANELVKLLREEAKVI